MISLTQAVILCGGRGERLRPLTDTLPKPMAPVNGRPFLCYLLEQLKENGFTEVLLLTGYRGEQIKEHFNNGSVHGIKISYFYGPAEWETGKRLYEAKDLLQEHFFLLYSDNFVQFQIKKLLSFYVEKGRLLSFIVTPKKKGNIRLADDGTVEQYDKSRAAKDCSFVELGYMVADKKILKYYIQPDVSFSDIITALVHDRQVSGFLVRDAYYSISDFSRLALMEHYLKDKKILLIDRDGVINQKAPQGEYISQWENFKFIDTTVTAMTDLAKAGFSFIIISNQAGIGRSILKADVVNDMHHRMETYFKEKAIPILRTYVCPHHWEDGCFCRKPNPGLFFDASREFLFRLDKTWYIGDDSRDCQAAYNAGCKSIFIGPQTKLDALRPNEQPDKIVNNLTQAVSYLVSKGL